MTLLILILTVALAEVYGWAIIPQLLLLAATTAAGVKLARFAPGKQSWLSPSIMRIINLEKGVRMGQEKEPEKKQSHSVAGWFTPLEFMEIQAAGKTLRLGFSEMVRAALFAWLEEKRKAGLV